MFDVAHGGAGLIERSLACELVKGFDFFEGIFFDAGADGLFEGLVQIDQGAGTEQAIDFVFAGRVSSHQVLEGGGFVGAEMVDMDFGIGVASFGDFVDEPLEGLFFLCRGEGPALFVG